MLQYCGTSLTEQISYFVMVHVLMRVALGAVFVTAVIDKHMAASFTPSLWHSA